MTTREASKALAQDHIGWNEYVTLFTKVINIQIHGFGTISRSGMKYTQHTTLSFIIHPFSIAI